MSTVDHAWAEAWLDLQALNGAYANANVIQAGCELGFFERIARGIDTADAIAADARSDRLLTRLVLNVLAGMGLLELREGRYHLDPRYASLILRGPRSATGEIRRSRNDNEVWLQLAKIMTGRASGVDHAENFEAPALEPDEAQATFNRRCASHLVEAVADLTDGADRVLDVGGGDGAIAAALLARRPRRAYTIVDIDREPLCTKTLRDSIGRGEVEVRASDALDLRADRVHDLVIVNELTYLFTRAEKERLMARALAALQPGGRLLLVKLHLDDDGTDPACASLVSLSRWLGRRDAYLETDAEAASILRVAGARDVEIRRAGPKSALAARPGAET